MNKGIFPRMQLCILSYGSTKPGCVIGFLPIGFVREGGRQRRKEGVGERRGERETQGKLRKREREREREKWGKKDKKRDEEGS